MKAIIVSLVVGALLGIMIGLILPYRFFYDCTENIFDTCTHGFWDWTLRILEVLGTFLAVVVALFKEWFFKIIYHPSLEIIPFQKDIDETINDGTNRVEQYYSKLLILNQGSANAVNCELYLSRLTYINGSITNELLSEDRVILWSDNSKRKDIPQTFSQSIEWFRVVRPVPADGNIDARAPQLIIGNYQIPEYMRSGTFIAEFKVVCQDVAPRVVKLELSWNGRWQEYKSQMSQGLQYKVML